VPERYRALGKEGAQVHPGRARRGIGGKGQVRIALDPLETELRHRLDLSYLLPD
jgi:hypothetical protein